jgi:hypothetical protein
MYRSEDQRMTRKSIAGAFVLKLASCFDRVGLHLELQLLFAIVQERYIVVKGANTIFLIHQTFGIHSLVIFT